MQVAYIMIKFYNDNPLVTCGYGKKGNRLTRKAIRGYSARIAVQLFLKLVFGTLKQYSEISGRLKHPFSLTPIDRYSLGI